MRRRHLLALIAAPRPALAQGRRPRITVIVTNAETDPDAQARAAALQEGLRELGWADGRNIQIERRWSGGDPARVAEHIAALLADPPQVIIANGSAMMNALRASVRQTPIVFVVVTDPVGAGFVESMARPGANITGFATYEPEIGGKWLDALRELQPALRHVSLLTDPAFRGFSGVATHIAQAARRASLECDEISFHHPNDDVEAAIAARPRAGLVVMPTAINLLERARLIAAAARHARPAIYPFRQFADSGGLMSYGFEPLHLFRRAAGYVDRILKGERPAVLPVQTPTRFEFVLNLGTARALGVTVPVALLAQADEVIE